MYTTSSCLAATQCGYPQTTIPAQAKGSCGDRRYLSDKVCGSCHAGHVMQGVSSRHFPGVHALQFYSSAVAPRGLRRALMAVRDSSINATKRPTVINRITILTGKAAMWTVCRAFKPPYQQECSGCPPHFSICGCFFSESWIPCHRKAAHTTRPCTRMRAGP